MKRILKIKPALCFAAAIFFACSAGAFAAGKNPYAIEVFKSKRVLIVSMGGKPQLAIPVAAIGWNPLGPKMRRGDGKTPEGEYRIVLKNERSICDVSLQISFPNDADARRALRHHLISPDEAAEIEFAAEMHMPPQDTLLGGHIFIHGFEHCMRHPEVTEGCIALHNRDMEKLFGLIPVGTPVAIYP